MTSEYYNEDRYNDGDVYIYIDNNKTIISAYYIDAPLMFSLKGTLAGDLALRLHAGPYISFGLFGTMESEYEEEIQSPSGGNSRESDSYKIKNVFSPTSEEKENTGFEGINRFSFGIGVGGGIDIGSIYIGVNYNLGLANLSREEDSGQIYERTLGITFGYGF